MKRFLACLALLAVFVFVSISVSHAQPAAEHEPASAQTSPEGQPKHESIGHELSKEEREAMGEEEEHADLKHAPLVKKLAKTLGLSDHQAHMGLFVLNFLLIVGLVYWMTRKRVPQAFRNRTAEIQRAMEEARAASADASRRLAEIETRLGKLDSEISQIRNTAENEAKLEEKRIQSATEEDIRKIVQAAEQEISAAGKHARRELTAHTANLAVALAQKQIHIDERTDQTLVGAFAEQLAKDSGGKGGQ